MANKQDSYWMECTLDEKVDQKVCEYLREHHAEYRNTKQKMKELMEQYPNVKAVFETDDAVTLTAEEHEILYTYLQLESSTELIEREYHFYMGQSMMFSYGSMLAKLKKQIMNEECCRLSTKRSSADTSRVFAISTKVSTLGAFFPVSILVTDSRDIPICSPSFSCDKFFLLRKWHIRFPNCS